MSRVRRTAALAALWQFVRGARRPGAPDLGTRVKAIPRLVDAVVTDRWDGLTKGRLSLMALSVLYIVSPVDVIPEGVLLALGLADDALVASWLAGSVLEATERFVRWERGQPEVVKGQVVTDE
ncbi:MAG: DUF1232 domain-containing protein [Jiangellaceae bacterium]|nr:DUF1232 domain-containing protein [Jiangellaceae bacterium]